MHLKDGNLKRKTLSLAKVLWSHPIEALKRITISKDSQVDFILGFEFDGKLQKEVMAKLKKEKVDKTERKFGFLTAENCRECLFQVKRVYSLYHKEQLEIVEE